MGLRVTDNNQLWPDGLVPYEIDATDFPAGSAERTKIMDAIKIINEGTNATFVPRDGDATYVRFEASDQGCGTNTGRRDGENAIRCDVTDFRMGSIVHEMCHELGLHHEQIREDRDSFVTVHWNKIQDDGCNNFKRKVTPQPANYSDCADTYDAATQTLLTTDVGNYDYGSIMHYGKTGFRKEGETGNTLTPTNPATAEIGQRDELSDGDIATLNSMYGTAAIYVRDNLTDNGEEPLSGGGLSLSPDIIHVPEEVADPQATFGTAAAMSQANLSEDVEFGQTNYVYVRLQKNGTLTDSAEVDLYWTQPSTLPTPAAWTKIGNTISEANIAPGDVRVVGPFLFNNVPAEGHYCFVALVGSRKNPMPDLNEINTSADFVSLVREKSNVAWKNFDVINIDGDGEVDMDFHVSSMRSASADNDLEFDLSALPTGIVPEIKILRRIVANASVQGLTLEASQTHHNIYRGTANANIHSFTSMELASREDTVVRLKITIPENTPHGAYDISVRQLKNGIEFGRITRRINVGRFPFIANKRSRELHRANCPWVPKMSSKNKLPLNSMETGLRRGYDGCHTCLIEHDNG